MPRHLRADRPADAQPAAALNQAANDTTHPPLWSTHPMQPSSGAGVPGLAALHAVRRFMRPKTEPERCELCGAGLAADHHHLVEPSTRRLACACQACGILFSGGHEGARFLLVPRGVQFLPDLRLTDEAWESLQLPINLAFF